MASSPAQTHSGLPGSLSSTLAGLRAETPDATKEDLAASHQGADDYGRDLEERTQGEVYGEAVFHTLAEPCPEPERAGPLHILERLGRETKEFLLEATPQAGLTASESAERALPGRGGVLQHVTARERARLDFVLAPLERHSSEESLSWVRSLLRSEPTA